ncbi:MAG: radical SAM protein [Candidatus Thorarchaeota archaeon]
MSTFRVKEVKAKTVLNTSRISDVAYAINPYVGCQHGCSYCYARFMERFTGHAGEEWGKYTDVKINSPEVLEKQLWSKRKAKRERVLLSSVTDAYQPLERRYEVTRRCLKLLADNGFPVSILTKSDLVLRDADLLEYSSENEIGATIITFDKAVCRTFEQGVPSPNRRLATLKAFSEQGLQTYCFVGPMIPFLTTYELDDLVRRICEAGVDYAYFDRMNLRPRVGAAVRKTLAEHFPDKTSEIIKALRPESMFYDSVRETVEDLCRTHGLAANILF